mmetsp:Transcript_39790/g.46532  ORF Transcript_39790/g.46532 Transcript_39790/m.46532 type:complete len:120 (+) Transcript_39790:648-1007(+)
MGYCDSKLGALARLGLARWKLKKFWRTKAAPKNPEIGRAVRTRAFEHHSPERSRSSIRLSKELQIVLLYQRTFIIECQIPAYTNLQAQNFAELFWFPLDVTKVTQVTSLFSANELANFI